MWDKPLPDIDADSLPLFKGYKDHEFRLFRCEECGTWSFPKTSCEEHMNEPFLGNITTEPASGRGEIFTKTVTQYAFHPGFEDEIPYTFCLIELEEGPLFGSQVIDIAPSEVEIEMPVEVSFKDVPEEKIPQEKREDFPLDGGFTLPYFAPANGGD